MIRFLQALLPELLCNKCNHYDCPRRCMEVPEEGGEESSEILAW